MPPFKVLRLSLSVLPCKLVSHPKISLLPCETPGPAIIFPGALLQPPLWPPHLMWHSLPASWKVTCSGWHLGSRWKISAFVTSYSPSMTSNPPALLRVPLSHTVVPSPQVCQLRGEKAFCGCLPCSIFPRSCNRWGHTPSEQILAPGSSSR